MDAFSISYFSVKKTGTFQLERCLSPLYVEGRLGPSNFFFRLASVAAPNGYLSAANWSSRSLVEPMGGKASVGRSFFDTLSSPFRQVLLSFSLLDLPFPIHQSAGAAVSFSGTLTPAHKFATTYRVPPGITPDSSAAADA
jgi:hypothetical protein